jgi:VWFA-related protein
MLFALTLAVLIAVLPAAGQVRIPARAPSALFHGDQGKQNTELEFDPASGVVTLKLLVQDPSGYFIPNIRRENFAVYENGVRQHDATVEIEHARVSLGLLLEHGGRYQLLNKAVTGEVARAALRLLGVLGREDKVAVWTYADTLQEVASFSREREVIEQMFYTFAAPEVSEANFYDAVAAALERMRSVPGRKAIVAVTTGVDTFSKKTFGDLLDDVRGSTTPVYVLNIAPLVRETAALHGDTGPVARIDWRRAEAELPQLAQAAHGRCYTPHSSFDLEATLDDMMENLRLRYVITYKSSSQTSPGVPRTVRVELVNSKTGGPLEIVDANGKTIRTSVILQDRYTPRGAGAGN